MVVKINWEKEKGVKKIFLKGDLGGVGGNLDCVGVSFFKGGDEFVWVVVNIVVV